MKSDEILSALDTLIPDPKCALDYEKDYELLIAVMLSAQSTDKGKPQPDCKRRKRVAPCVYILSSLLFLVYFSTTLEFSKCFKD